MRFALGVAAALIAAWPAAAAETGGCGKFKWPVDADIALLSRAPNTDNGATLDVSAPVAARLKLVGEEQAGFAIPPERKPPPAAPAGVLRFEAKAGTYQITLTDAAWTDLVQDGKALHPSGFAGVTDCDGARKSLRFELSAGPALLQVSNSPTRAIGIAVTPIQR